MTETRHSILIVDDEQDTCSNLKDILEDLGYDVDVAYDGPMALAKLEERTFDTALLDLKMPGMDGLELYRRMKQQRPQMVAIVVTAFASSETAADARRAGAWQVLSKPVDIPRLLAQLHVAAEQPKVMVVDDDPDFCASIWDVLRERGYRVSLAHGPDDAVRELEQDSYQVVCIDMKLDGSEAAGEAVFQLVRGKQPASGAVLMTAHRQEMQPRIERALQAGASGVCYKPLDLDELLGLIDHLAKGGRG